MNRRLIPKRRGKLDLVADLGMRVERRMTWKQIEVALEQQRDATASRAGQPRTFASPEIAVMHERGVGARGRRVQGSA